MPLIISLHGDRPKSGEHNHFALSVLVKIITEGDSWGKSGDTIRVSDKLFLLFVSLQEEGKENNYGAAGIQEFWLTSKNI